MTKTIKNLCSQSERERVNSSRQFLGLMIRTVTLLFCVGFLFLGLATKVQATTYYANANSGNDSWDGLYRDNSLGGTHGPKLTAGSARVLTAAGDTVYLSGTFREQLIPNSGSAGSPITWSGYPGDPIPIISAADLVTGWTLDSGNIYWATYSTSKQMVLEDGVRLNKATATSTMTAGSWYWDSGTNKLYVWTRESDDPTSRTMEISSRASTISANQKSHLIFKNIKLYGSNGYGVTIYAASGSVDDITFDGVEIAYNYTKGINSYSSVPYTFTNVVIENSNIHHNGSSGMQISGINGLTVQNSHFDYNASLTGTGSYLAGLRINGRFDQPFENFASTTVDIDNDIINVTNNYPTNTPLSFSTTGTLPASLAANSRYYAINVSPTQIKVSASSGGSAVNLTSQGSGTHTIGVKNPIEYIQPSGIDTSADTITVTSNILTNTDIKFVSSGTLPSPLAAQTDYYAINVDSTHIKVAASLGGAAIDLTSQGSGTHSLYGERMSKNITIENSTAIGNGLWQGAVVGTEGTGIWLDTVAMEPGSNNVVRNCLVKDNVNNGIHIENDSNVLILGNVSANNGKRSGVTGSGIGIYANASPSELGKVTHNKIYNNVCYGNGAAGIEIAGIWPPTVLNGACAGNEVKNNIAINNSVQQTNANYQGNQFRARWGCENDGSKGSGNVYSHNSWGAQETGFVHWGQNDGLGVPISVNTYSAWETSYGSSTNSIQSDPQFVSSSDFTLQATSPAIDAGANLGSDYDDGLSPASTWPSSVTTIDQDLRGSGWEIGAYVYPVPITPTIGTPSAVSASSIRWNFTDNADDETGFRVYDNTNSIVASQATANLSYLDETGLSCSASYSGRYIKAYNSYGESVASVVAQSESTNFCPGGGLPAGSTNPPKIPAGGFNISINNGAETITTPTVTLNFKGGPDTARMAISNFSDFKDASQENYTSTKQWNLCQGITSCQSGTYTVYARFYTAYGQPSQTVSDSIVLKTNSTNSSNPPTEANAGTQPSTPSQQQNQFSVSFTKYLRYGQISAGIKRLQIFLNQDPDTQIAKSGAGSPGKETNIFGYLTKAAVIKFQEKYAKDVLAPWKLTKGTGFVGRTTISKINQLLGF